MREKLIRGETENCCGVKCFAELKHSAWEALVIRRVGKMLRFEAEGGARGVVMFSLPWISRIQMIPCVKLHARFRGQNLQDAAGIWIDRFCGTHDLRFGGAMVNDPIVIVPGA